MCAVSVIGTVRRKTPETIGESTSVVSEAGAKSGLRSGVDYIAVDGRFMGGEAHDSTSSTINLPIQGMTIPRTQVSRSTVTVLP